MTIRLETDAIVMEGDCGVDDVESLLVLMDERPDLALDIGRTDTVHTAIWQLVVLRKPALRGRPRDSFMREHLLPAIGRPVGIDR